MRTTPYQNMNIRSLQLHLGTCDKVEPMAERRCGYECLDDSRGTRWVYAEDWLDKGKIGIGWDFGSKDIASMKREQIRATYLAEHPK